MGSCDQTDEALVKMTHNGIACRAEDAAGLTIIPLNMAEPILILRGSGAAHGLGYLPHGAAAMSREAPTCSAWRRVTARTIVA